MMHSSKRGIAHLTLPNRPQAGRIIAGVCVATGDYFKVDVSLVRLAFLLLCLAWGIGLILYGVLWMVMPGSDGKSVFRSGGVFSRTARGVRMDLNHSMKWFSRNAHRPENRTWVESQTRRWMALGFIAAGASIFFASLGAFDWLNGTRAFGLATIAIGVALLVMTRNK